jgi:hypothetical protein
MSGISRPQRLPYNELELLSLNLKESLGSWAR